MKTVPTVLMVPPIHEEWDSHVPHYDQGENGYGYQSNRSIYIYI